MNINGPQYPIFVIQSFQLKYIFADILRAEKVCQQPIGAQYRNI